MKITLVNVEKKYDSTKIITDISYVFEEGMKYAILGGNGSGKSTLLKILSGNLSPSKGRVCYFIKKAEIDRSEIYRYIGYAAPYLGLITEFDLIETATTHFRFKELSKELVLDEVPEILGLHHHSRKPLKTYSNGMLQRVKLGLALLSSCPLVLLDEPTNNLDSEGVQWYQGMIDRFCKNKTVIVCSNSNDVEYGFCEEELFMENYK